MGHWPHAGSSSGTTELLGRLLLDLLGRELPEFGLLLTNIGKLLANLGLLLLHLRHLLVVVLHATNFTVDHLLGIGELILFGEKIEVLLDDLVELLFEDLTSHLAHGLVELAGLETTLFEHGNLYVDRVNQQDARYGLAVALENWVGGHGIGMHLYAAEGLHAKGDPLVLEDNAFKLLNAITGRRVIADVDDDGTIAPTKR